MGVTARTITVRDLAEGAADIPLFDADGALAEPVLIVDLDDADPAHVDAAAAVARDRILVGRCSGPVPEMLTAALDVNYGPGTRHAIPDGLEQFLAVSNAIRRRRCWPRRWCGSASRCRSPRRSTSNRWPTPRCRAGRSSVGGSTNAAPATGRCLPHPNTTPSW